MKWTVLGFLVVGYFVASVSLTARAVGGWNVLKERLPNESVPMRYFDGALVAAGLTAVLLNPLDSNSLQVGDWLRTAVITLGFAAWVRWRARTE